MYTPESIQPLVSVVLCTYNGDRYIRQQLDSILSQTYSNIELVVSDDASADATIAILEEYTQKDKRIRFFINSKNIGYNKNFEKTIQLATSDLIAISDQDDIWEPEKIMTMMMQWPNSSAFIYSLSGNFTGNDFENRLSAPNVIYGPISGVHQLVFNSPVHGHACMFNKNLLAGCLPFPKDIFYDWWISMHAVASGTIGCVPQTLTWHRVHDNNFSRSIMSIKEKKERDEQLRRQCVYFIETFCNKNLLKEPDKASLLEYALLLKTMDGKRFSLAMFRYVMRNRKKIFHYKKSKPFIEFSYLKHALRMGYKGLL